MGSSSAITACGSARLGVPTAMVGVVGNDLLGTFVTNELARRGVDVTGCLVDGTTPTGSSTILTLPSGDRSILTASGSIGAVAIRHVPAELVAASAHVHVGAYFLQSGLKPDLAAWFSDLRGRGLTTSLDPNYDPAGTWDSGIADVLDAVDVFFCNEHEAMAIAGASTPQWAVTWLLDRMPEDATVVLKLGPRGAVAHFRSLDGQQGETAAAPALAGSVVDTVGAGDSLAAGYLAARMRSLDRSEALAVGVANGTASTRAAGGIDGQLDWAGVLAVPDPVGS
jgi:sugar/nucleoside kinase (ribokinase family)